MMKPEFPQQKVLTGKLLKYPEMKFVLINPLLIN